MNIMLNTDVDPTSNVKCEQTSNPADSVTTTILSAESGIVSVETGAVIVFVQLSNVKLGGAV